MSHHIIKTEKLSFTYPDKTPALHEVSFFARHGETIALIGANGAGKSTLLFHLCGIFLPQEGTVTIGEHMVTGKSLDYVRRSVGMIFQNPDDQLFMPTVGEDVAFGPRNLKLTESDVQARVEQALDAVGAGHLKARQPYRLSAGEKRLAAIAGVLAMQPDILLMDEPTSALDPYSRRRLINLLKTFKHTILLASHDLDFVLDLCARTMVMANGRIIADEATAQIFTREDILTQAHLEKPLRMQAYPAAPVKP